ncbi:hydroxyisourate hydrolase [Thamnocephalis sphaerospora]|uniref:5-hydroxyisourate hydrolase n=1 Tax=Thamnocephalis sphaerospora TaxID=78915 RepID=A0A4P9XME0_9FUNG|nr:hydroxyisourate hydrolase [Thamnocephalis sphaerospora]RKP07068.1 hydroxyisourate hydrolase [Thamnocephalis sphaerospora]|eukprot:RKP06628.1 hydroxyisourate hydrolase [Thamnocephalis sphaerospora]
MTSVRPPITSHVLDTGRGRPAKGVPVTLEYADAAAASSTSGAKKNDIVWSLLGRSETNEDGRCPQLMSAEHQLKPGLYRVTFNTKAYYTKHGEQCFYPYVQVVFELTQPEDHYHIPLLLSPYSYSTYRGS